MLDLIVKRLWHDARASNIPVDLSVDGFVVKPLRRNRDHCERPVWKFQNDRGELNAWSTLFCDVFTEIRGPGIDGKKATTVILPVEE